MTTTTISQFDIDYERDTANRHSWHINRAGEPIGRVWLVRQGQWTNGDRYTYSSRLSAAAALASRVPMEG